MKIDNIPKELKELSNWVLSEKDSKTPYQVDTKHFAKSNKSITWSSFTDAINALNKNPNKFCGIAFAITKPYAIIDLDSSITDGNISDLSREVIDRIDSYTEKSLSGTGLHIIIKTEDNDIFIDDKPIEIYSRSHFMTLTGDVYENRDTIQERDNELKEIIQRYVKTKKADRPSGITREHTNEEFDFIILNELNKAVIKAIEGNRHNTGVDLACQLRDNRIPYNDAVEVMKKYQSMVPHNDHPYLLPEALTTLKSVYEDLPREPSYQKQAKSEPSGSKDKTKNQKTSEFEKHKRELTVILAKHDACENINLTLKEAESYIKQITNPSITGGLWNIVNKELNLTEIQRKTKLLISNARELENKDIPEPIWIVPGYIPEGLTILAGKPKIGKSWLALGLAVAIASGGRAFGNIDVFENQGRVLYLGLEDNETSLKDRLRTICQESGFPEQLDYTTEFLRGLEGVKVIETWLEEYSNARLVIIDTFISFRGKVSKSQQSEYERDSNDMQPLQRLAGKFHIGIMLIHHLRKAGAEDDFDTISGTLGLTGKADSNLILKRIRGEADAILKGTGRNLLDVEVILNFDPSTAIWNIVNRDASEYSMNKERVDILQALKDKKDGIKISEISLITGRKTSNLRQILYRMKNDGSVILTKDDKYILR